MEDFRRKRVKASLSPLLTQDGIMTAPVLNVLCHWDSWTVWSERTRLGNEALKVSVLEAAGSGTLCRAVHVRETGSRAGMDSSSQETAARAGPGAPGRSRALRAASAWELPNGSGHECSARRGVELRTHELLSAS